MYVKIIFVFKLKNLKNNEERFEGLKKNFKLCCLMLMIFSLVIIYLLGLWKEFKLLVNIKYVFYINRCFFKWYM